MRTVFVEQIERPVRRGGAPDPRLVRPRARGRRAGGVRRPAPRLRIGRSLIHALLIAACAGAATAAERPVPAPFEPVAVVSSEESVTIDVWGRRYVFARGPLPISISSQGIELLAAPPRLEIATPAADSAQPAFGLARVVDQTPGRVELLSTARHGGLEIEARTRIEYDGMIQLELVAMPSQPVVIESFSYTLPLRSAPLLWFNHHVPYDYAAQNVDKQALVDAAGPLEPGTRRFAFTPTFFVGGRDVGVELWWETNRGWSRRVDRPPITVERGDERTTLQVQPLSLRRRIGPARPLRHTVALFPTPLRPPVPRWRSNRFVHHTSVSRMTRRDDLHYYWIAFPAHFDAIHHGLPAAKPSRRQRALRRKLEAEGVGYIPYAKLTAAPSGHPETIAHADEWAANDDPFRFPPPDERELLRANTAWQPGQVYGYPICADRTDYLDFVRAESVKTLVDERTDGLYYDFGSITRMCERATSGRNRRRTNRARVNEEHWDYLELRRFYKQLYEDMQARAPGTLLTIHTHGQPRALGAWVDYTFVGEALNVLFRGGRRWDEVRDRPDRYDPDYLALPEGWLEAMVLPPAGGVTSILPQLKAARDAKDPARLERYQRAFLAWVLVNDVHIWHGNADAESLAAVYRALDRFGSLDDARWLPWWRHPDLLRGSDGLRVTAYARDAAVLLVVSNLGDRRVRGRWPLDVDALGAGALGRVRDLEAGGPAGWSPLRDGRVELEVGARDFRLLLVEPGP